MARSFSRITAAALLVALILAVQGAGAATDQDIQDSIDRGIAWLAAQQNSDGSWGVLPDCPYHPDRVEHTSLAVIKLIDRAKELGKDWYDDTYAYKQPIRRGLEFLSGRVRTEEDELDYRSIWDYNPDSPCEPTELPPPIVYDTSLAIMAFSSSGDDRYKPLVQDALEDYIIPAQATHHYPSGLVNWFGGWSYFDEPSDMGVTVANQRDTFFSSLALVFARNHYDIPIPESAKTLLRDSWINKVQHSGGGSYSEIYDDGEAGEPMGGLDSGTTSQLIYELKMVGIGAGDTRVTSARDIVAGRWDEPYQWQGNYPGMYAIMTGLEAMGIGHLDTIDWYQAFADYLIENQAQDGSWLPPLQTGGDWATLSSTEWALLTLDRISEKPSDIAVEKSASAHEVGPGGLVEYTVVVTNFGTTEVYTPAVNDDKIGPLAMTGGDSDGDGVIDPGEAWTYTGSMHILVTTTNIATLSGKDGPGPEAKAVVERSNPVTVFVNPGVSIDIKMGSCPNAFNLDDRGLVSIAVVGKEGEGAFDVSLIDAESVVLWVPDATGNLRPVEVMRWALDDSAIPYEGTGVSCGCIEYSETDGILDLTFKFRHEDVAALLGWAGDMSMVPLTITGNLYEGTPFTGSDCVRVQY